MVAPESHHTKMNSACEAVCHEPFLCRDALSYYNYIFAVFSVTAFGSVRFSKNSPYQMSHYSLLIILREENLSKPLPFHLPIATLAHFGPGLFTYSVVLN